MLLVTLLSCPKRVVLNWHLPIFTLRNVNRLRHFSRRIVSSCFVARALVVACLLLLASCFPDCRFFFGFYSGIFCIFSNCAQFFSVCLLFFGTDSLPFVKGDLLFVKPMLNVLKHLFRMDMWHVVMSCQLLAEVRLPAAGLASQSSFEWLQAALFAEFFFDQLDVGSESLLAMPVEVVTITFFFSSCFASDKQGGGFDFDVEEQKLAPV